MTKKQIGHVVKGGKKINAARKTIDQDKFYSLGECIDLIKKAAFAKFDENFDIVINLGVDPKHSDQMVRGVVAMPHGTGKTVKIAVFAKDLKAEEAVKAGADFVGGDDLVAQIQKNEINFDVCVATPDMMGIVGKVAKILGPKGKMPNPKLGTVTTDVISTIKAIKSGQVEFKVEKTGIIHAGIGKLSFDQNKLIDNAKMFIEAVVRAKPSGSKGTYLKSIYFGSTMSPAVRLDVASLQLSN